MKLKIYPKSDCGWKHPKSRGRQKAIEDKKKLRSYIKDEAGKKLATLNVWHKTPLHNRKTAIPLKKEKKFNQHETVELSEKQTRVETFGDAKPSKSFGGQRFSK